MEQNYDTVTACTLRNAGGKKNSTFLANSQLSPQERPQDFG